MQANRRRDTAPELRLRRELHHRGLRFRVDYEILPGTRRRADIVFTKARVAVFVHGCFWHGCPTHGTSAKSNAIFWAEKIKTNRERDADTLQQLRRAGWRAIEVWEHEDVREAADRVVAIYVTPSAPAGVRCVIGE